MAEALPQRIEHCSQSGGKIGVRTLDDRIGQKHHVARERNFGPSPHWSGRLMRPFMPSSVALTAKGYSAPAATRSGR
jgi:hypothetical protein